MVPVTSQGVNKVIVLGYVGSDADLKFTAGGKPVANFSVAVNEPFKNSNGDNVDRVEWFRCLEWRGRSLRTIRYAREAGLSRRATADAEVRRQGRQGEDDYRGGRQHVASLGRFEKWIGPGPGGTRGATVERRKWRTGAL